MPRKRRSTPIPNFQFIAVSGDNLRGDSSTRRQVRSHAQADYRRRHPHHPPPSETVELDPSPFLDGSLPTTCMSSPRSILDASWSDPFATFPVDRSHRTRELWSHLYDGTCPVFRSMYSIGFTGLIRETVGISQMLSLSCWHLDRLRRNTDSTDYAKYASVALSKLQQQLRDPAASTSDDVVAAVMAFATYAYLSEDPLLLNIHMDGLANILRKRGGESSLETNPVLRIMLYWVDINGCHILDRATQYPHPYHLLATRSKLKLCLPDLVQAPRSGEQLEDDVVVLYICDLLRQVKDCITSELKERNVWREATFAAFNLLPILHDILSMSRGTVQGDCNVRRRECFRLAVIIYITQLLGKFGLSMSPGKLYGFKLQTMLNGPEMLPTWGTSNIFLIWILTVGASCSCVPGESRDHFTDLLSSVLHRAGITRFQDLVNLIYDFIWCDEALGSSFRCLEEKIMLPLWL